MLNILKSLFRSTRDNCIHIYNEAKEKKPEKKERDYLKIVLITKPPFDFQLDKLNDDILDTCDTIEKLAEHIDTFHKDKDMWENRERNLNLSKNDLTNRNEQFFNEFWS